MVGSGEGDGNDPQQPSDQGGASQSGTSIGQPQVSTRLTALEIAKNVLSAADAEFERPAGSLFWSSLASGLAIGFSFLFGAYLMTLAAPAHRMAAAALAYPLGFILVILARSELFTENTLTPVLALLERKSMQALRGTIRVWAILLVGNLIGTLLFALVLARTPVVDAGLHTNLLSIAEHAVQGDFGSIFYRAIFAGWLIAHLTWVLASTTATGAQIVLIYLITWTISALGFTHAIVGSSEAFYLAVRGAQPWGRMIGDFILPAVLGNAVGGVLLVALLNYGQVASEVKEDPEVQKRQQTAD